MTCRPWLLAGLPLPPYRTAAFDLEGRRDIVFLRVAGKLVLPAVFLLHMSAGPGTLAVFLLMPVVGGLFFVPVFALLLRGQPVAVLGSLP